MHQDMKGGHMTSTYVLVNEGCGSFLNPPGDAEHSYSVYEYRQGYKEAQGISSLRGALTDTDVPEELKEQIRELMKANPPDVKNEAWIRSVYNYFRGGYTKDASIRNVNDRENVYFVSEYNEPIVAISHAVENAHLSLGYLYIKEWDSTHEVRRELLLRNWKEVPAIPGEAWAQRPKKELEGK
jgi:hypothetical protein